MSDLGANHLLIVRRLQVVDEPLDHLIFQHGGLYLCARSHHLWAYSRKDSPVFFFCPLKNCAVGSYLSVEPIVFQERVGHLPLARGVFQSCIPCGHKAGQIIQENLAKQRVIIPIGSDLRTNHVQVCARVSSTIILDKLWCLELGRHNYLREIGQIVQINTSTGIRALYDTKLLSQSFHLALYLAITRFGVLVFRRILVITLGRYIMALILY